ncbi:NUDIX hydrolase [Flammeovirgaceae bacterium SG7u.111]|nr:NUDIX hydrolase [Flammeovirgaceae bacterium SG7u.132]WPO35912.1 NUDIX hydrolase [Flammeovirgaceae bacterium SG7u.111]
MEKEWHEIAKRIQALAQNGITFTEGKYDMERYEELREISAQMMSMYTDTPIEKVRDVFNFEHGYQTPKVDVRGVVFKENKILMVQEEQDGKWSLPGGWADVNYSPRQIAVKEVWEETGLRVEPVKLLAVLDKACHPHPLEPYQAYKFFIHCKIIRGELRTSIETLDVRFFGVDELPQLSAERVLKYQIEKMFELVEDPNSATLFD